VSQLVPDFQWRSIVKVTLHGYSESSGMNGRRAVRYIAVIGDDSVDAEVPKLGPILQSDVGGCLVIDLLEDDRVEVYIVGTRGSDRSSAPKAAV
jgi:hypothetical protein